MDTQNYNTIFVCYFELTFLVWIGTEVLHFMLNDRSIRTMVETSCSKMNQGEHAHIVYFVRKFV